MLGAWPSRISQIDLDWEAQNQVEVFQVVFAYDYWLPDSTEIRESLSRQPILDSK